MKRTLALFFLAVFSIESANALQSFEGKVTAVEPTYLPARVSFAMTTGTSVCPAGTFLVWQNADQSNNKAVYMTLLTAFVAGKTIRFYYNDGDATCTGRFLHVIE